MIGKILKYVGAFVACICIGMAIERQNERVYVDTSSPDPTVNLPTWIQESGYDVEDLDPDDHTSERSEGSHDVMGPQTKTELIENTVGVAFNEVSMGEGWVEIEEYDLQIRPIDMENIMLFCDELARVVGDGEWEVRTVVADAIGEAAVKEDE